MVMVLVVCTVGLLWRSKGECVVCQRHPFTWLGCEHRVLWTSVDMARVGVLCALTITVMIREQVVCTAGL